MKKVNIISFVVILVGIIALALFRVTGLVPHIIVSVIALIAMLACMVATKKSWKVPGVEILYRVFYLIALITGFVLTSGSAPVAVAIVHKVCAAVFAVLFIVSSVIAFKPNKE